MCIVLVFGTCDGAKRILSQISSINRIENVLADGGYSGKLQQWFHRKNKGNKRLSISKKLAKKDFKVIPKRWIVERTFAWFGHQRRLAKDYEINPATSLSRLFLADSIILLKQLTST